MDYSAISDAQRCLWLNILYSGKHVLELFLISEYILHASGGDYCLVSGIKTSQGQSRAVVNIKI